MGEEISTAEWMQMCQSAEDELRKTIIQLNHQKYKRCLSMKWWCASRAVVWNLDGNEKKSEWYWKWKERWKELAEKFREDT